MTKKEYRSYEPSPEEIQKAEQTMTNEQKLISEAREEGYELGKRDTTSAEALEREKKELRERTSSLLEKMRSGELSNSEIQNLSIEDFLSFAKKVPFRRSGENGDMIRQEDEGPRTYEIYRLPNGNLASGSMWRI